VKAYSFYDPETGALSGSTFYATRPEYLAANTPRGLAAVEGEWSASDHVVDLNTKAVVARSPMASAVDPDRHRRETLVKIAQLEARQMRPLRELAIDPHDRQARDRVSAIDAEIAALRTSLI
jgi:hypothetical protein